MNGVVIKWTKLKREKKILKAIPLQFSKIRNCEITRNKFHAILILYGNEAMSEMLETVLQKEEQEKQQEILPEYVVKPKSKLTATNFRKSHRRKTEKTAESKDPAFENDKNKQCFEKYNCTDVYVKTRLAKIDRQKWSELSRDFKAHGDQIKSNLDPQGNKLNGNPNRKSQIETIQNKIKAKQFKEVLEVAENITKQGKKLRANPVKRISATSNFIYEFNPFANAEQLNPLTSQTCLRSTNITSFANSNSNAENGKFVKRKPSAVLPELNSRTDFVKDHSDWNVTDSTQDTCLPILGKENPVKTLSKQLDDRDEPSNINHEMEKVKSAWQALRAERNWTKGKDCIDNVHTKKLYEILEKMTCEVDKIQGRYRDPKANYYLRKSATNVLKTAMSTISLNTCDKKQDTTTDTMELAFKDDGKTRMKIKSSIEKYLQNYSDNIHKPRDIEEKKGEERFQDIKSSASDIADILASHNIGSYGLYENFENRDDAYDSEDCTSERDKNFPCSNIATNTTQVTCVDTIQDDKRIRDNTFLENTESYRNDIRPTKVDVKSIGTSRRSNLASCSDNAFIKMGLNVLEKNLSRDKLSQILQSEYLKKNLSL
ncbi:math and lrr domain-containing protein [Lasius niger]|uniref:Math and lrr domain-containing protein n=1 Tax=Lasius niger TaxID=67767 RepID=A0A0J7KT66_LASNI|nr:math and lrr domain-containing protein [Lasius niger]